MFDTNCHIIIGPNATLEKHPDQFDKHFFIRRRRSGERNPGPDDGCSPGGGVQIVTHCGFDFPAGLKMYRVQVLALRKINFEANTNGVEGVSLVTTDEIDSTSNDDMGFCNGAGMENSFEAEYFRLKL